MQFQIFITCFCAIETWKKKTENIETPCLAQRRCVERQLHGGAMQGVPTITGCGEEAAQLALRGPAAVLLDAAQQGVAEAVLWIGTRFLGPGDFWDSCELR